MDGTGEGPSTLPTQFSITHIRYSSDTYINDHRCTANIGGMTKGETEAEGGGHMPQHTDILNFFVD